MSDELYRVVFAGVLTGEYDLPTTKKRFGRLFRLNEKRTEALFSGKEYIVKNNVAEEVAMQLAFRISEAGCECYVQEITEDEDVDYEEKRSRGERRLRFRRPPRPGAIVPDRRLQIRRRKDRTYYLDLKKHNYDIPISFQSYINLDIA